MSSVALQTKLRWEWLVERYLLRRHWLIYDPELGLVRPQTFADRRRWRS